MCSFFLNLSFGDTIIHTCITKAVSVTADVLGYPWFPLMLVLTPLIPKILIVFTSFGFSGPNNFVDSSTADEM